MWCIGELTAEYRRRMYELLALYARPYDAREPVICVDEKCKQLLRETRPALPAKLATLAKEDYEYERAGTCNIFVAVEPRGQRRIAQVTARPPRSTSSLSSAGCCAAGIRMHARFTWSWITSTSICARASKRSSV